MVATIHGSGIVRVDTRKRITPEGTETIITWKGRQSSIEEMANDLSTRAAQVDISRGALWTLIATFADDPDSQGSPTASRKTTWQLLFNSVSVPLKNHPEFEGYAGNSNWVSAIQYVDRNWGNGEVALDVTSLTSKFSLTGTEASALSAYLTLRNMGVEYVQRPQPVIRKTIWTSKRDTIQLTFSDVGRSVSYASIGVPDTVRWDEPQWEDGDGGQNAYNWIKQAPQLPPETGKGKLEIIQEWWGVERASNFLYGGNGRP